MESLTIKTITWGSLSMLIVLIVLTIGASILYPENLNSFGRPSVIWVICLLIAYSIFVIRIPSMTASVEYKIAFTDGSQIGILAGIFNMIHLSVECFVYVPQQINRLVTLCFMGVLFILFGISAYITITRVNKIGPALTSGIWCSMVSIFILFMYGFLIDNLFFSRMKTILRYDGEFLQSKMNLDSFVIHNTLESAGTHLLEAPFIATIFSLFAVLIKMALNKFRKKWK